MNTAYLVAFYDAEQGVIVHAAVYSEPSPTVSTAWAPIIVARITRTTYAEAERVLKHWIRINLHTLAIDVEERF